MIKNKLNNKLMGILTLIQETDQCCKKIFNYLFFDYCKQNEKLVIKKIKLYYVVIDDRFK